MTSREIASTTDASKLGVIVAIASVVGLVSSCDGGGSFAAAVEVTNGCQTPIAVSFESTAKEQLESVTPANAIAIEVGESVLINNALLKPIPETVYVYVAAPGDSAFINPKPIDVASLPKTLGEYETDIYSVEISDALCLQTPGVNG